MLNTISNTSISREPRVIVRINKIEVKCINVEVTTTTYYQADNFRIEFPLHGQSVNFDFNYFAASTIFAVEVYVGFPPNPNNFTIQDLDLIIVGNSDEIQVDPVTFVVAMSGRDLTSLFIDNKTTQKFANKTASDIAILMANTRGLTPVVTPTKTPVGVYYQNEQSLLTSVTTEWDLLTFLAQQENFVVFVEGNNLFFKPRPTGEGESFVLQYKLPVPGLNNSPVFNGMDLRFKRSMTLAQDVIVIVRVPFSPKSKKAFTVKAKSTHNPKSYIKGLPQPTGKAQTYVYVIPGISKEQAVQRAQQLLKDITIHEIKLSARLPGDNSLKKDSVIKVQGTNSVFDQLYFTDYVRRTISMDEGYSMDIQAKNHDVDSQVALS